MDTPTLGDLEIGTFFVLTSGPKHPKYRTKHGYRDLTLRCDHKAANLNWPVERITEQAAKERLVALEMSEEVAQASIDWAITGQPSPFDTLPGYGA